MNNRHWKAYRIINNAWYDLDSKLEAPIKFKQFDNFLMQLM